MVGTIALILAIIVWLQLRDLQGHVKRLVDRDGQDASSFRRRVLRLEQRVRELEHGRAVESPEGRPAIESSPAVQDKGEEPEDVTAEVSPDSPFHPDAILRTLSSPPRSPVRRRAPAAAASRTEPKPPPPRPPPPAPSALEKSWGRLERHLVENWTGILGAAVLVAGITFIGGYAGLRLAPIYRSLMIAGAAGILAGGSWTLRRRAQWTLLADWLRSSGAAVFLLACFGSSAIPALRWITSLPTALGLLVLGLAVNLAVAFVATRPSIASLHVVLSVIPLSLVPQSITTLVLGTAVGAAGTVVGYRARWPLTTLVTLGAFSVFHVVWLSSDFASPLGTTLRLAGASSVLAVCAIVAWNAYRADAADETGSLLTDATHLAAWTVLTIGVAVYTGNPVPRGSALLVLALAVLVLGRYARARGHHHTFLMDTLVAQAIALVGLVAFFPVTAHWLMVPAVASVLNAIFLLLAVDADEPVLERVAVRLLHATVAVCVVGGIALVTREEAFRYQTALLLFGVAVVSTVAHLALKRARGESFDSIIVYGGEASGAGGEISLLAVGIGLLLATALANVQPGRLLEPGALVTVVPLLLLSGRFASAGLGVAAWLILLPAHLWSWSFLLTQHPVATGELLSRLAALGAATGATIVIARTGPNRLLVRHSAVYLLALHLGIAAYTLLEPQSTLAPGIAWLLLSLVALETANRFEPLATPLILSGYGYLAAFAVAYVVVVLPTETYWGPVPVRGLVEAFAVGVGAFWWRYRPRDALRNVGAWQAVHPVFLELVLGLITTVVFVEVSPAFRPMVWTVLALASASTVVRSLDRRFPMYSVLLYWASALDMVVVTSALVVPSPAWYEHPMTAGLVTMVLQVAYLATVGPRLELEDVPFPAVLGILNRLASAVSRRKPLWLYYPFFVGGALFLYWRFDGAILTLLWAFEAFSVFVLSLLIRERHFRYMAMAGLGASLIRLIVYDMAQTNLGLRGIVFIGVGLLMLGMHSLYNRYRDRFV